MKRFLARLKKSDHQNSPPPKLLDEAGRLCQRLQHSAPLLEKLVMAMTQGRHWEDLCTRIHVIQACVLVHLCKKQYDMACKILESCAATEKEELVRLWHEVHYRKTMEERHVLSLTPVQRYRCRKRCPPPASLCPEGVKSRNYPKEVRETLRRFAVEVTSNPSRKQRQKAHQEKARCRPASWDRPSWLSAWLGDVSGVSGHWERLASETDLTPQRICSWFSNYRRRQKPRQPRQPGEPPAPLGAAGSACRGEAQEERMQRIAQAAGGFHREAALEWREWPLLSCPLCWDHPARAFPLWSSTAPSEPPGGCSASTEHLEHPTKVLASPGPQARAELGAGHGSTVQEAEQEPGGVDAGLRAHSRGLCPAQQQQQLVERQHQDPQKAPGTIHRGVQCNLWSWDASCQCSCSRSHESLATWQGHASAACSRIHPGALGESGPRMVSEQADSGIEALLLGDQQLLGTSWAAPCSSAQSESGKPPNWPVAPTPCPEESQVLVHEQMSWALATDPSSIDTLWAASLLCEFSLSSRRGLP